MKRYIVGIVAGSVVFWGLIFLSAVIHETGHWIAGKGFGVNGDIVITWWGGQYFPHGDLAGNSFFIVAVSGGLFAAIILLIIYYVFTRFAPWRIVKAPVEFAILAGVLSQATYLFYELGEQWSNSPVIATWGMIMQVGIGVLLFPIVLLIKKRDLKSWWEWCDI